MSALTKIELDLLTAGGCHRPGCKDPLCGDAIFFAAKCHPGAGLSVEYWKDKGVLKIICRRCEGPVAQVKVSA